MTPRSAPATGSAPTDPLKSGNPDRDYALDVAAKGFALLAHAVNACDNPATRYRFGHEERDEFMSLCAKLYSLIASGNIESRAAAMAQGDLAFQRFVKRSLEDPT